jgi:hypothetical protein
MMGMSGGRYRLRTWFRGHLPGSLAEFVPKGARRARDRSLPSVERRRYQREEKFRGLRSKRKRR